VEIARLLILSDSVDSFARNRYIVINEDVVALAETDSQTACNCVTLSHAIRDKLRPTRGSSTGKLKLINESTCPPLISIILQLETRGWLRVTTNGGHEATRKLLRLRDNRCIQGCRNANTLIKAGGFRFSRWNCTRTSRRVLIR